MAGPVFATMPAHFLTGAILSLVIPLATLVAVLAWWAWIMRRRRDAHRELSPRQDGAGRGKTGAV